MMVQCNVTVALHVSWYGKGMEQSFADLKWFLTHFRVSFAAIAPDTNSNNRIDFAGDDAIDTHLR